MFCLTSKLCLKSSLLPILSVALLAAFAGAPIRAQTVVLSDASVLQPSPYRIGINIGSVNSYDNGQVLKNLFGALNPGFEPLYVRSIWVAQTAGTATTFVNPDQYDTPTANQLVGSTYTIVESATAAKGCTGTITANTAGGNSIYTLGTPCAAATSAGDQMMVYYPQFPTVEATWEASQNHIFGSVSNGGKITTDSTGPYDGQQSIMLDTSARGAARAEIDFYADGPGARILLNGIYTVSIAAKRISGSAVPSVQISRVGGPGCNLTISSITSSWVVYSSQTCAFFEPAVPVSQGLKLSITQSGIGINDFDDVSFVKTSSQNSDNISVFRDEVVATLQSMCGTTGPKCVVRNWLNQDAETFANWTSTATAAAQGTSGYTEAISGTSTPRLQDYLTLVQVVNGIPYLEVPSTFTTADASSLITYLATNWVGINKPFPEIYLTFCNECWNNGPSNGVTLPWRPGQAYLYQDYALRESSIYHAMRTNPGFSASLFHLGMDIQLGTNQQMSMPLGVMAASGGSPDFMELAPYTQWTVSNWQTISALWSSAFEEPWGDVADPASSSGYYQSVAYLQGLNLCGSSGTSPCIVANYEQNNSTWGTCGANGNPACTGAANTAIDQAHEDYITAGGGEGIVTPLQALLNLQQLGVRAQAVFALTESGEYTLCGPNQCSAGGAPIAKLWGSVVDMGGLSSATNAATFGGSYTPRPSLLGLQIANAAIIGPMFSCPITGQPTYNWPGDPYNGPTHALNYVPYLYAFCFKDTNGRRSAVLINTNLTTSYKVTFAGTNAPTGTVSLTTFAPPSPNSLNEPPTGTDGASLATMSLATSKVTSPSTITVPAVSVVEVGWDVSATPPSSSFAPIPDKIFGVAPFTVSATSASPGPISYSVISGPATLSGNVVTVIGIGTVVLQASQAAPGSLAMAIANTSFNVTAATPSLSLTTISAQTYGVAPFSVSAASYSSAAISYSILSGPATIAGSILTVTGSGTVVLQASQAAGGNYTSATATTTFVVNPAIPTLNFNPIPAQTYGVAPFAVSATSNSPGTISYSILSGPATIAGNILTVTGVGSVVLQAIQAAGGDYTSTTATTTFVVNTAISTLTFDPIPAQTYNNPPFPVSATSNSPGTISYSILSGPATIAGNTLTVTGVGTVILQAIQAAVGNYPSATATTSFVVNPASPTLTFNPIPTQTYGVAPFTVSATSNSSSAIYYSILSGPAIIAANTLTVTGAGTVVLQAIQAAAGNYTSATAATSFVVNPAIPTLTFNPIPQTYGNAPFSVSAASNSPAAISYSVLGGPATISGNIVSLIAAGVVTLQASQPAANGFSAATATTSFNVSAKAAPTTPGTLFASISNKTYGVSPFTVTASSNSPGAITYSVVSGQATISGNVVTITGVGAIAVKATQAPAGNYLAGLATASFSVNPATPILAFVHLPIQVNVSTPFAILATSKSAGTVTYHVVSGPATISGNTVTPTAAGIVTLRAEQAATGNYTGATTSTSLQVK